LFTCGSARRISYAAHVDRVPAITLASLNALSYLALHRSRLGELVGHLCTVEMTSSAPSKLYSTGLRRLGFDRDATRFYHEHVEADAMHEQIVARDLAGGLARAQPHRAPGVLPERPGSAPPSTTSSEPTSPAAGPPGGAPCSAETRDSEPVQPCSPARPEQRVAGREDQNRLTARPVMPTTMNSRNNTNTTAKPINHGLLPTGGGV